MKMWSLVEKIINRPILLDSKLAMVSFTFDDAPLSSFTNGGKILEENGFRGTYYISSSLIGQSSETGRITDLQTILEFHGRGHEIANHTDTHLICKDTSPLRMALSIQKNKKQLKGIISNNFSYPYGSADASSRCIARICTSSARGIGFGINRGWIDPAYLEAVRIYNRRGIEKCLDLVSACAKDGGWLIFYTHDVCDEPSDYGCKVEQFAELVKAVSYKELSVFTVKNALNIIEGC